MSSILQAIEDWFKGLLVSGVMNNLNFTLLKEYRSFTFSAQVRDVLNKGLSVSHSEGPTGTTDSYMLSLGRHFLAGVIWRFGKMGDK